MGYPNGLDFQLVHRKDDRCILILEGNTVYPIKNQFLLGVRYGPHGENCLLRSVEDDVGLRDQQSEHVFSREMVSVEVTDENRVDAIKGFVTGKQRLPHRFGYQQILTIALRVQRVEQHLGVPVCYHHRFVRHVERLLRVRLGRQCKD